MRSSSTAAHDRVMWLVTAALAMVALAGLAPERIARAQAPDSADDKDAAAEAAPAPASASAPEAASAPGTDSASAPASAPEADSASAPGADSASAPASAPRTDSASAPASAPGAVPAPASAAGSAAESDVPVDLRLRRLEQKVQALKERAWRAKARVSMLEEAVLGGGVGASATIVHLDQMGSTYRLVKLVYALDGTQIFARTDDSGTLDEAEEIEIFSGPIAPGNHTLSVLAIYQGHGYGVFEYLDKYRFTARASHTFTVTEGSTTRIEAVGLERGGVTTPLEQRPAVDFKLIHSRGPGGS